MTIHIEVPFPYFAKDIYYIYTVNFAFILGSILVAALVCFIISKLIVRHLMKLIHSTVNLPEEVRKNRALNIMDSPIYEFSWLKKNFDHIVYKLSDMFTESEEMNKSLEEKTVELIESEERLRKLAFTDSLTQLPNRHYFMKFLQYLESTTQPDSSEITALLFIDLDKFKEVNDSLGHDAGDDLLRYVATTLTMVVDYGTVYRLAGDEFVIIINDTSKQEVDQTCEKLLLAFESPILIKNQPCEVNLSIGVALHPIDGLNFSHILNLSDRAMYKAKEGGGGSFVYYSDLHQKPEWM
ncbi:Cyclic di-GMP phosphodiesterase Gmr [compost metagenome]